VREWLPLVPFSRDISPIRYSRASREILRRMRRRDRRRFRVFPYCGVVRWFRRKLSFWSRFRRHVVQGPAQASIHPGAIAVVSELAEWSRLLILHLCGLQCCPSCNCLGLILKPKPGQDRDRRSRSGARGFSEVCLIPASRTKLP
jgi:hypothetical protein